MCRCAPRRRRCTPTPAMPRGFASRAGPGSGGRGRPWRRRAPARQTRGEGAHAGNAAAFVAGGLWANPEPQRAGRLVPKESTTVPPAPAAGPRADPVNRQRFPPPPAGSAQRLPSSHLGGHPAPAGPVASPLSSPRRGEKCGVVTYRCTEHAALSLRSGAAARTLSSGGLGPRRWPRHADYGKSPRPRRIQ